MVRHSYTPDYTVRITFCYENQISNVVAVTQQLQVSALAMGTHATLHDSRTVSISRIFL